MTAAATTGTTAPGLVIGFAAGSGEPLVLLHGLGLTWRSWLPLLPALAERHAVLALDLPGFGGSPPLPGLEPGVPALADAVERRLDDDGLDAPHLAGNSLGGWVALELARRGRARSVTAIAPAGLATAPERAWSASVNAACYATARALAPVARLATATAVSRTALLAPLRSRPWRVGAEEAAYELQALSASAAFPGALAWMTRHQPDERLDDVRCPVLVLWGADDRLLGSHQAARFAGALPDAAAEVLPRAGHVPMSDDPDAVAGRTLAFTARVDRSG